MSEYASAWIKVGGRESGCVLDIENHVSKVRPQSQCNATPCILLIEPQRAGREGGWGKHFDLSLPLKLSFYPLLPIAHRRKHVQSNLCSNIFSCSKSFCSKSCSI